MIVAEHLTKRFKTRRGVVVAVDDVNFVIEPGEFVGFVGPNGAGKSTTLKMLCGVLVPTAGELRVEGLVPARDRKKLARRMGVVFGQRTQLWWDLPLRDSFRLVGRLWQVDPPVLARRVDDLTALLELGPLLDVPVRSLSLGQRMRGELAAAVLPAPRLLFLDEPTIGLDVEAKAAVRTFLARLNQQEGTTILLTTHDLGDIARLCRRIIIIDHGRLIYDGALEGLKATYAVSRGVVVDLADGDGDGDGEMKVDGATLVRSEGQRRWLQVPRDQPTADVIARILARYKVEDLIVEEPDLEDIIRRIYRQGTVERGARPSPGNVPGAPRAGSEDG